MSVILRVRYAVAFLMHARIDTDVHSRPPPALSEERHTLRNGGKQPQPMDVTQLSSQQGPAFVL